MEELGMMAFVGGMFAQRHGGLRAEVCTRGRSAALRRGMVTMEQLISKPVRPNSPTPNQPSKITDYSKLTDVRPDPLAGAEEEEEDEEGVDDGDPDVVYYTECGRCKAVYDIRPKMLGMDGKKVQCSVCHNQWFQKRDRLMELDPESFELEDFPDHRKGQYSRDNNHRSGGDRGSSFTAFIGNLAFSTTESELRELFDGRGAQRVHIVEKEGKSKGYAFVDFDTRDNLDSAIDDLNGCVVGGRDIIVKAGRNSS